MNVLFDHQAFVLQRWGGISRYFFELLRGLCGTIGVELALARTLNVHVPELNRMLGIAATDAGFPETFLGRRPFPLRKQLRSIVKRVYPPANAPWVNRRLSLERIRAGRYDLFHPTYYDPYFLDALAGRPFVLTVHDLTHEVCADHFSPTEVVPGWKRRLARAAARLIAVSESTKRDLVRLLDVDPARVDVVHHGFAPPQSNGKPAPAVPERYVLFTGTRVSYKNWELAVRALAPILRDTRGLHLVCTGLPFSRNELAFLRREKVADRVVRVAAGEGGMPSVYERARAFVFPSLYEGFGLPVLEAFAAGCPAALARASSLPEVGGDAALYFGPKSPSAMRDAVDRLLSDADLRASLVARGRARVRGFTWERTCAATAEAYRRALA
jgi:glycosyltransferase involved in cell wall biosynthesis